MTDIPRDDFMATPMPVDPAEKWKARARELREQLVGWVYLRDNGDHAISTEADDDIAAALAESAADGKREVYDLLDAAGIDDDEIRARAREQKP